MRDTDKILALIVLVLVILGSMFILYNRRMIVQDIEFENNIPDTTQDIEVPATLIPY